MVREPETSGRRFREAWRSAGRYAALTAAAVAVTLVVLGTLLVAAGFDASLALTALWRGAFGSTDALLSSTLVRATPLLLAGIGMSVALRAGVLNIGGDGQLLAGATAAIVVGIAAGPSSGPFIAFLALLAAAVAGSAWAAIPAFLKARFGALEVVSTIMMNFVAVHLVSFLVRGPLQEPSGVYPQSASVAAGMRLPILMEGTRLHAGVGGAIIAAIMAWFILEHTATGFRVRMVGRSVAAARSAGGIDITRVQGTAFLASGALAGLAGGVEILGVTFALYENLSPGYGYTAIAVALLGRLRPLQVIWASLLLGALGAGAAAMQRDAGVPAGAAATVEAALVLAVLAGQVAVRRLKAGRSTGETVFA